MSLFRSASALWHRITMQCAAPPYLAGAWAYSAAAAAQLEQPVRGMKWVSALRKRCEHCRIQKIGKVLYIRCDENPRHKQRQG